MQRPFALLLLVAALICGCSNHGKVTSAPPAPMPAPQKAVPPPRAPVMAEAPSVEASAGQAPVPSPDRMGETSPRTTEPPHHAIAMKHADGPAGAATRTPITHAGNLSSGGAAAENVASGGASSAGGNANESDAAAAWHKSLPRGKINHPVLETMELNKPYPITVTLSGANAAAAPAAAGTETDTLQVSPRMIVELTEPDNPDGFKIDPADAQPPKLIASDGDTTWNWTVTPQHLGNLKLHISAYVLYEDDPNNRLSYDTFDAPVTVHSVTVKHEEKSAWEWIQEHPTQTLTYLLPGGAGAAILGKLIDWWRKRRKKGAEDPKDDSGPKEKAA